MDIKLLFAIIASVILIFGYSKYFRDIFQRKTKPHLYTWLVWAITQTTATIAIWYGGGNFGTIGLTLGTILVIIIFLLSFKYGTKDITKTDTLVLILALIAIFVWWQLKNPWLAVFMVSTIDASGYIPTYRKSFSDPWSETLSFWFLMVTAGIFTILALKEYNFLTVTYSATLATANSILIIECLIRRKMVLPG